MGKMNFRKVLSHYEVGSYETHEHVPHAVINTIYIVKTSKGKNVIKVFASANARFIKFQTRIIDYLDRQGVPIQRFLRTKKNDLILKCGKKNCVLYEYVDGGINFRYSHKLIEHVAEEVGVLHRNLLKMKFKGGDKWGTNHQFKGKRDYLEMVEGFPVKEEYHNLVKELKDNVNKNALRRSIIHSDLSLSNMLFRNNKLVAFIDWDDSHWDYLIYDIAILIAYFIEHGIDIKHFFKSYQKQIKINEEEKKALYYFIKTRWLSGLNHMGKQRMIHKERAKLIGNAMGWLIKRYREYEKTTLMEFLEYYLN